MAEQKLVDAKALSDALYEADAITMKGVVIINQFPTIEAKPVVHAHWKEYWDYNYGNYSYCCSNCEKDALTKEGTMYDQVLTELCPYCGAQMDEKED